ncbi:MAG: Sec-independent protein translocase protein TatB [Limnobacter sp.]|nr:Sec-independent protein translocase protein TatB [Limnobacter sp.]
MFDIGFTEMMFIAVVALIVIGPEKLPKVARTIGHLFGRAQRYVTDVKSEINREMEIEDLRKLQAEMQSAARSMEGKVRSSMSEAEDSFRKQTTSVQAEMDSLKNEVNRADSDASADSKSKKSNSKAGQAAAPSDSENPS